MTSLIDEGHLYCNTFGYFKDLENDSSRGDTFEGALSTYDHTQVRVELIDGDDVIVLNADQGFEGAVTQFSDGKANLYCFYGLHRESAYVDSRNYEFGRKCVLVHDLKEFFRRLEKAVSQDSTIEKILVRPVEYMGEFHRGDLGPFRKFAAQYAHQSEFRLLVLPGDGKPKSIRLGSLNDIAEMFDSESVNERFALDGPLLPAKNGTGLTS